jgi:hypothetical protein
VPNYLEERAARVALAKGYPFPAAERSCLVVAGTAYPVVRLGDKGFADATLRAGDEDVTTEAVLHHHGCRERPVLEERVAVLAYGSNAAPEQLARKFARFGSDVAIPLVRGRLVGVDVVYAPHVARYGAIPATLAPSPATSVSIALLHLTAAQVKRMHETELSAGNYVYGELSGASWTSEIGAAPARMTAYVAVHGALGLTGAPLALEAVRAEGRSLAAMAKVAVLALARDRLAPGMDLDDFIDDMVRVAHVRAARTRALRETAVPLTLSGLRPIEG